MKKLFTLTLLMLFTLVGSVTAQEKKTWDFSKGWSDETLANLEAGSEWSKDGNNWKETGKFGSGGFVANGEPIKELIGLERSSAGLSKNNNYLLTPTTFRLNRDKQELIFPSLKNGQKLTIVGRSANSSAENRGVKPMYDYMVRIDDDKDNNLILGSQVEGSKGTYTFVYEIQTSETGEVPVGIKMITGGIDFTLFMIDDGDPQVSTKIAYLYDGTEDDISSYLPAREETNATLINVTTTAVTAEELKGYDVVIVGDKVPADNAAADAIKEAMPWTPVLNLNPALYAKWGYGETTTAMNVGVVKDAKSKLLTDMTIDEAEGIKFINLSGETISAIKLGEYFAGDAMPVTAMDLEGAPADDYAVAHIHNEKHNAYIYMPHEAGGIMIGNAINMLAESKSEITAAKAPVISRVFKDLKTEVTITAAANLPKAKIYYTTNGDVPTEASTLYEGTFTLTEACTVKAVAIGEGYLLSEPAEMAIEIHQQPKSPAIASVGEDGKTTVTLTCESEDAVIWYNFDETAGNDTLKSTKYTEPFVITMPQNVTAFSVAGGAVFSELTQKRVLVQNPRVVIDVAAHFSAPQWDGTNKAGLTVNNGKGMFSWGASAVTMYTGEGTLGTDPDTGDEITIYTDADLRDFEVVEEPTKKISAAGDPDAWAEPEWVLKSRGTCLIWQNTGALTTNFGDDSNYNPSASTDVDPLFPVTKNDIQFYKFKDNEPGNGSIETLKKYQAPLDVVVLANMAGGPLLAQVSADGSTWQTIGEIAKTDYSRLWGKYTHSYDGTDEVFVRITQEVASAGAKVFDIYIANQGEQSQALKQQLDNEYTNGVQDIEKAPKAATGIYNMNGMRQQGMKRGLNIVVYGDGTVKKVLVK